MTDLLEKYLLSSILDRLGATTVSGSPLRAGSVQKYTGPDSRESALSGEYISHEI